MKIPELIAHRGYAAAYPENTIPAFQAAIAAGARYLECDVQLSGDLTPVLFHDEHLERQCGRPGRVRDYTLAQLREFSAGCPDVFGDRFAGVGLATLAELVELLRPHPRVTAFIELKKNSLDHFGPDAFLDPVLVELAGLRERAVPISFEISALDAVRRRGWPRLGAVLNSWLETGNRELVRLAPDYLFCDVHGLPAQGGLAFPGARLAVYEVADVDLALRLAARGVELIETFAIDQMRQGLNRIGQRQVLLSHH
jgi:glycerophosphoryl diester phosphodiesterase